MAFWNKKKATEELGLAALRLMALNQTNNPDEANLIVTGVEVDQRRRRVIVRFGEVIDGTQARIRMIYPDRVILELQGRDETLMLDGEEYGKPLPVTPTDIVSSGLMSASNGSNFPCSR